MLGRLLNDQKRYEEARTALQKVASGRPDHGDLFFELGRASYGKEDWVEAEKQFRKAHGLQARSMRLHLLLANVLIRRGNYPHALQEMKHYLKINPDGSFAEQVRAKAAALEAELARSRRQD